MRFDGQKMGKLQGKAAKQSCAIQLVDDEGLEPPTLTV